ncbi:hypothetical protein BDD12DRAFT_790429 [Trichophaea hybrida]|nr:hypothetical protein BDD12DRAFT_790429 [Trichophaea hybrida]
MVAASLRQLYPPPPDPSHPEATIKSDIDIVFVHGLNPAGREDHSTHTWTHANGTFWPEQLLPKSIPSARILLFSYNSNVFFGVSNATIRHHADSLLDRLHGKRMEDMEKNRPILFVCHSLGGLLVKQALVNAKANDELYDTLRKATFGLVFFGTPHCGGNGVALGQHVANVLSAVTGEQQNTILSTLKKNSVLNEIITDTFCLQKENYEIVTFFETMPMKIKLGGLLRRRKLIVDRTSAKLGNSREVVLDLNADHSSLCKFSSLNDEGYETVARHLQILCGKALKKPKIENINALVRQRAHFMVPFSRNTRFIARSKKLAYLRNKLEGDEPDGHRRLALWGLGGVGKTQNVLDFIYEFKGSQVSVFWVHAGSTTRLEQDYRKLAELLGLPGHCDLKQDIRPVVKDWFERPESGDWILVLDNADNKLDFFPENSDGTEGLVQFIPHGSKGTVIITTRDREVGDRLADMNVVHCEAMNMEEAKELFQLHYPKATDQDHESILVLLEGLQFLPLAIVHVAAYLRHNSVFSPSSYLMQFNSTRAKQRLLLSKPHKDIRRDSGNAETVLTTFSITFVQVQEQSPLAGNLLKLMACVDRQGIPHDLLARSGLEGSDDEVTLSEALSKLANFSLLTHAGSGNHSTYEIHSLVHLSIEAFLSLQGEMEASIKQTAELLVGILPNGDSENWPVWRIYLPHASAFVKNVTAPPEHIATIYYYMAWYFRRLGRFFEAEHAAQKSIEIRKSIFGLSHQDTILVQRILASIYNNQGRYKEAEELGVLVLEMSKSVCGQEHRDTLISMVTVASTYRCQGRWKEAEALGVLATEMSKRVQGQEHPETLISMNNLALTYEHQGRWKEVETLQLQVLEVRKRVLGNEHPNTLISINNLASIYEKQGRLKEAEELQLQLLEAKRRVLDQEHPSALATMVNLASIYKSQGRWKEAEALQLQVIEVMGRKLGQEHPDTLISMSSLASTYRWQGRWKESEVLHLQVLDAMRRILGQEHPSTLTSMNNLASTYRGQGRWQEAEALYSQVLELTKTVFGQEHPSTLTCMDNLTRIYESQDRINDAIALMVQTVALKSRVLGKDHPSTSESINALSEWRDETGVVSP